MQWKWENTLQWMKMNSPQQYMKVPVDSHPSQCLVLFLFWTLAILLSTVIFHFFLICISPVTDTCFSYAYFQPRCLLWFSPVFKLGCFITIMFWEFFVNIYIGIQSFILCEQRSLVCGSTFLIFTSVFHRATAFKFN